MGVKTPPATEVFFNFLTFFEKKNPKTPIIFAFHTEHHPSKISDYAHGHGYFGGCGFIKEG